MASFQDATNAYKSPFSIPTTSGDLVAPGGDTAISNTGAFTQPNLLPGSNPNLPTTYAVPGAGDAQVPYRTIDVPATAVPENQLSAAAQAESLAGTNTAGALPSGASIEPIASDLPGITGTNITPIAGNGVASAAEEGAAGVLSAGEAVAPSLLGNVIAPLAAILGNFVFPPGTVSGANEAQGIRNAQSQNPPFGNSKGSVRRKGNYVPNPNRPDPNQTPRAGSRPIRYHVTIGQNGGQNNVNSEFIGPIGGISGARYNAATDSYGWYLTAGDGEHLVQSTSSATYALTQPPILGNITASDGSPDPAGPPTPPSRTPTGVPVRNGTIAAPTNSTTPKINPIPNSNPYTPSLEAGLHSGQAPTTAKQPGPSHQPTTQPPLQPGIPTLNLPTFIPPIPAPNTPSSPTITSETPNQESTPVKAPNWDTQPGEKTTPEYPPVDEPTPPPGACQSSPCMNQLNQKMDNNNDLLNKLNALLSGLNLGGLLAGIAELKTLIQTVQTTLNDLSQWLGLDRLLNFLTFVTTLHNAYMLSSAIEQTLLSTIDSALGLFGIHMQDSKGNPISLTQYFDQAVDGFGKSIFGIQTWDGIKKEWAALNRIYQAATNLLYAMQALFYSVLAALEVVGQYVANIGNALKKWRVIGHAAFGWMNVQPNFHNSLFTNLNKGLLVVSQINFVVQSISSVKSILEQMGNQQNELVKDLSDAVPKGTYPENTATASVEKQAQDQSTAPPITLDDLNTDLW